MNDTNPAEQKLVDDIGQLVNYRLNDITGDEKGDSQVFLERLFQAYGHAGVRGAGAVLEARIKRASAAGGTSTSFADLLWRGRCLIEMKKAGTDLKRHYRQALDYWIAAVPDRPRYVVLCNFDEFWIYDFDLQLDEPVDRVKLVDLPTRWDVLAFMLPVPKKPVFENDLVEVTRRAAAEVSLVFRKMTERGVPREQAQRFVLQTVMCMFAEDVGLLPKHTFWNAMVECLESDNPPAAAFDLIFGLFREMNTAGVTAGGRFKGVPYFNGGLFANIEPFDVTDEELAAIQDAARTNWSFVRPEIFGTIFEDSMDVKERHDSGAHFTSQADIASVVIPTIVEPWRAKIDAAVAKGGGGIKALEALQYDLTNFRVLDPACGSGNFLYVAYRELRRLEHEVNEVIADKRRNANIAGQAAFNYVSTAQFFGLDVNPFAVEMAKITMMLGKKLAADELADVETVLPLENLDVNIVTADALFDSWPDVDAIVGNPPFLGRRFMASTLGADYTSKLAAKYPGVGGVSDFVSYWFPLTHDKLKPGQRAGLVATNTIRQNDTRKATLDYIVSHDGVILEAVSSQPWSGAAAVHVSIVNWMKVDEANPPPDERVLWVNEGDLRLVVPEISSSLSPDVDVKTAADLSVNMSPTKCFQGQTPGVSTGFVIKTALAESLADSDGSDVVIHPFLGGRELLNGTSIDRWIVDIPDADYLTAKSKYPATLAHLEQTVLPSRSKAADKETAQNAGLLAANAKAAVNKHHAGFLAAWWSLSYRRGDLIAEIAKRDRYIATSRVSTIGRPSVFEFVSSTVRPSDALTVFALDDDYSLGILSSKFHRLWIEARASTMKSDIRYTSTSIWNSYPFPQSPSASAVKKVTTAVAAILALRGKYLSSGLTLAVQYDSLATPGKNPLRDSHAALDLAVQGAYGFNDSDAPLTQLLALNQLVHADPAAARGPGAAGIPDARVTDYRFE